MIHHDRIPLKGGPLDGTATAVLAKRPKWLTIRHVDEDIDTLNLYYFKKSTMEGIFFRSLTRAEEQLLDKRIDQAVDRMFPSNPF